MVYQSESSTKCKEVRGLKKPAVFVHGICHGAWCWKENFVPYFTEQGHPCYPVDLRGHGGDNRSLKGVHLSDYVEDVRDVVEKCVRETGMRPFLVGHSMGGAVVQQYIGKYSDTVEGAVLLASATAPRMPRMKTILSLINKNLRCAFWIACGRKKNWANNVHNAAFFTGKNEAGKEIQRIEDTTPYESLLQKEAKWVFLWDLYNKYSKNYNIDIPVFVIGSAADAYFPKKSLIKTARKYAEHKEPAYECLEYLCHDMMIDKDWGIPAELILKFIEDPATFIKEHPWPQ